MERHTGSVPKRSLESIMPKAKEVKSDVVVLKSAMAYDKLLATLATSRKALETIMHQAAVSALWHVGQHKDTRQISKLFDALEDSDKATSILTNSLRAWFEQFGPVRFDGTKVLYIKDKPVQLAKASDIPFWKFKKQSAYVAVDLMAMLEGAIKKLIKDQAEVGVDHARAIAGLEALMASESRRLNEQMIAGFQPGQSSSDASHQEAE